MAQFTVFADSSDLEALVGGTVTQRDASSFAFTSPGGAVFVFTGTGFAYDAFGLPTGGTVTGVEFSVAGTSYFQGNALSLALTSVCTLALGLTSGVSGSTEPDSYELISLIFSGNDQITGTLGNDRLFGLGTDAGNDTIYGGAGNDDLRGGLGDDTIYGGDGNDWLSDGLGTERLIGGAGINGAYFSSDLDGAHGIVVDLNRRIEVRDDGYGNVENLSDITKIEGADLGDRISGDKNDNLFWGYGGNDTLSGRGGHDWLFGGAGKDRYFGGAGVDGVEFWDDAVTAGARVNLSRGRGNILNDGFGNVETATSIEKLGGTSLADHFIGNARQNYFWGYEGNDALYGGAGNDELYGGAGNDALYGGRGADYFSSDAGVDSYFGGAGVDGIGFYYDEDLTRGVVVDLGRSSRQILNDGHGASETATSIEVLYGSDFNDSLTGGGAAETLYGNGGDDTISGGSGDDLIFGGDGTNQIYGGDGNDTLAAYYGTDVLTGGAGADYFDLEGTLPDRGVTRITDLTHGLDRIGLGADLVGLALGPLDTAEFASGNGLTAATTTEQRIIYNRTTGDLYLDADGKGGAAAVLIATLTNHAALSAGDILIW